MVMLDAIDDQLLRLLGEDARQPSHVLAKKLDLSPSTVRRRIRRLIHSRTLRIVATIDPSKAGNPVAAMIASRVDQTNLDMAVQALSSRPEVRWLSTTTGRFNMVLLTRFRSTDELSQFLQKEMTRIEGLKDMEVSVCLHVGKGRYMQA